jgi:hypothetical protein
MKKSKLRVFSVVWFIETKYKLIMAKNLRPQSLKAPDKGSFPLDHFHECDNEA